MTKFETQLVSTLGEDYKRLISEYGEIAALHAANLVAGYGENARKTLERVIAVVELSAQMLYVFSGKVAVASDMPKEQIIKWTPNSETIQINIKYLKDKNRIEDARKLMIAVHTAVFMKHVRAVVESPDKTVKEYAEKTGWLSAWKNPVDPLENPKLFFEQKHVKDALAYGITYTENALMQAGKMLREIKERTNE